NEEAEICFAPIQPENLIMIYDTKVSPKPKCAMRFWVVPDLFEDEEVLYIDFYTDREIVSYKSIEGDTQEIERRTHPFEEVPIVEYINNDERQGDFEKVITLIDAYDKVQSDVANDFETSADAYLVIRNMSGTQESDLAEMRKRRAIFVDDDGDATWLIKDVNDSAQENYKLRLQEDIHRFSLTPNLTDEKFAGTVTGIALQYKMWGLEQRAAQKERKFKQALQRRIELICKIMSVKGKDEAWSNIAISFSRNAPAVLPEIIDMVTKLKERGRFAILSKLCTLCFHSHSAICRPRNAGSPMSPQRDGSESMSSSRMSVGVSVSVFTTAPESNANRRKNELVVRTISVAYWNFRQRSSCIRLCRPVLSCRTDYKNQKCVSPL
ncbi:MAG: phage portal protein, partial [Desulfovermiculus sp.]